MFLLRTGLSLYIIKLSFNSSKKLLRADVMTVKLSREEDVLQESKWSLTAVLIISSTVTITAEITA